MTRWGRTAIVLGLVVLALPGCKNLLGIYELDDDLPDAGNTVHADGGDGGVRAEADAKGADGDARGQDEFDAALGDGPDACPACGCVDLSSDPKNCGACGHDCAAGRHVGTADGIRCLASKCILPQSACATSYGNCNDDADDGCETDLTKPEHCVSCMNVCDTATPLCTTGGCKAACPAETPVVCGQSCVDTASDPKHCSDCAIECTQPATGGNATCTRGVCGVACLPGNHLCDGKDCARDDDAKRCGASCTACPVPDHGKASCSSGGCGTTCDTGYKACGSVCLDTANDVKNCGDCGHDCTALAHIASTTEIQCVKGACVVPSTACATGWGHCTTRPDDGCETDLNSRDHCHDCMTQCPAANPLCTQSGCTNACQPSAPTLCGGTACVDLNTDAKHCGDCDTPCQQPTKGGNTTCEAKTCKLHCVAGFHACGQWACESDTDATQCEGPNCHACPGSATGVPQCVANACTLSCLAGSHLCGGACVSDTDNMNCGAGCLKCPGPTSGPGSPQCSGGGCTIACNQGYHACGTTCVSNTDAMHCGDACMACPGPAGGNGSAVCSSGTCDIQCAANYHRCGNACLADAACTPPGNACHTGVAACAAGMPTCQDTGNQVDGTNCGGTNVCHAGVCTCTGVALGCVCNTPGALACNGTAQKLTLLCQSGVWQSNGTCSSSQNCDQTTGSCASIVSQCAGHTGGFTYCEGQDVLRTCGADLVSTSATTCTGVCAPGSPAQCAAPRCGDGKVEGGEECDDGNSTPVDNCENNCIASKVLGLAAGVSHACALLRGGYVRCWGANDMGQLGLGHTLFEGDKSPYQLTDVNGMPAGPIDLGGLATAITAGQDFSCALLIDGSVRCWGTNSNGELGLGHANTVTNSTPGALGALDLGGTATAISAKSKFACALLQNGTIRCWGVNNSGQLGLGDPTKTLVSSTQKPSQYGPISFASNAIGVACGVSHACALLQGGSVQCWGNNPSGQLGLGTIAPPNDIVGDSELPKTVPAVQLGTTANALAAGASHTCARLDSARILCWGLNSTGQLGVGNTSSIGDDDQAFPGGQVGLTSVTTVAAGSQHTCALLPSPGGLRCWGLNNGGQLGYPDLTNRADTGTTVPANLPNISIAATSVVIGGNFTCALLTTGEVRCWGLNSKGQLGLGMVSTSPLYVGGDAAHTPDKLPSVRIFP